MYILYNLILFFLLILYTPVLIFNLIKGRYREGLEERFGILPGELLEKLKKEPVIWIHAASVGETKAAVPLVQELKNKYPQYKILFSTMTDTGREMAKKNLDKIEGLIYLPLDFTPVVKKVINKIDPRLLITIETELWPNLFKVAEENGTRIMVVSGRISDKSIKKYKYLGKLINKTLNRVDVFSMQTELDVKRIISLGAEPDQVKEVGNIKYDQKFSSKTSENREDLFQEFKIKKSQPVVVAGSTHQGEEKKLISVFKYLKKEFPQLLLLLAPRYIERTEKIEELFEKEGIATIKRTEIENRNPEKDSVIIINTIGELADLYNLADLVFVGGSLVEDIGGHNILEPAACGKLVFFGRFMSNFKRDVEFVLKHKAAVQVKDTEELTQKMKYYLSAPEKLKEKGCKAAEIIEKNRGAVAENIKLIKPLLEKKENSFGNDSFKNRFKSIDHILIVRLSAIGDVIHALPVARAVRNTYPEAEISWVVEKKARDLVETNPHLDQVFLLPKACWKEKFKNNKLEAFKEAKNFFDEFKKNDFDLVLDVHGLFKSSFTSYMSGAFYRVGPEDGREGSTLFYNHKVDIPEKKVHQVERNLKIAEGIGAEIDQVQFDIVNTEKDISRIDSLMSEFNLINKENKIAVINPYTTWSSKNWPESKYIKLAQKLIKKMNWEIIFTGGPGDREKIEKFIKEIPGPGFNAAGKTGIRELAELYKRVDLFIGGDTGPMHLAAAVDTPIVALMGPTDPQTHGPYGDNNIVIQKQLSCINCWDRECSLDHACMESIKVEEVTAAVKKLV